MSREKVFQVPAPNRLAGGLSAPYHTPQRMDGAGQAQGRRHPREGAPGAMGSDPIARHIVFIGHVQGVGFRYTAQRIAEQCGLTGYIRNLPDGTVEMLAQGSVQDLDLCLEQIEEEFGGYVRDRRIEQVPASPRYTDFRIAF